MKIRVCCVCLGNICRSPTAEGILLDLVKKSGLSDRVSIDSAGTAGYHLGSRADARSRAIASRHGVDLPSRGARFDCEDFDRFDYVLAMDSENASSLKALARDDDERSKIFLFRSFDSDSAAGAEVPDPYYGGDRGFEEVFRICERAAAGFVAHLQQKLSSP
ncbi:MAG: low molecular weight protein-tyrosine-phosphatase [Planctomycetota bacterium]